MQNQKLHITQVLRDNPSSIANRTKKADYGANFTYVLTTSRHLSGSLFNVMRILDELFFSFLTCADPKM